MTPFSLEAASTFASEVDGFALYLLAVSGFVTALIFVVIITFVVKFYRAREPVEELASIPFSWVEWAWTLVPILIFTTMFAWGAKIYLDMGIAPTRSVPIFVLAKQWMWKFEHSGGQKEINSLHVPVGLAVRLVMTSQDVIHSLYVPAFRIKQDVVPGRYTYLWFKATKPGIYRLFCAEFCGTDHSGMGGSIVVLSADAYADWLAKNVNRMAAEPGAGVQTQAQTQGQAQPPAEAEVGSDLSFVEVGRSIYEKGACHACHGVPGMAPSLANLYGSKVTFADGSSLTVDENYLRESILQPQKRIVAGFPNIMPSFQGQLTERQLHGLIEYIKTLSNESAPAQEKGSAR